MILKPPVCCTSRTTIFVSWDWHGRSKKAKTANPISFAHDRIEALDMLRGTNGQETFPRPCLILLDLNVPRMDGIEFLMEIRRDDELKKSILFVMTTSGADEDKIKAYNLGVAGYILKTNPAGLIRCEFAALERCAAGDLAYAS